MNANIIVLDKSELRDLIQEAVTTANQTPVITQPSEQSQTKFLSINDMCQMFGVSRITISTWMKQGRIPFKKVSRRVYFILSEVMEALPQFNLSTVQAFQKSLKQGGANDGRK